ncbi:MAG: hypothetical protein NTV51_13640 [Verrucomicrobia bacterium]|nr:hypothetical protein [Verrucomicrobiota bacterium]
MSDEEKELHRWETLPGRSGEAFAAARARALAAGQPVVQSDMGVIYEVLQNGGRREIKRIDPPVRSQKGKIIALR